MAENETGVKAPTDALLDIEQIVETLQNNSTDGRFNAAAQTEFASRATQLRNDCDVLEKQRVIQDTTAFKDAVKNIQAAADAVKSQRQKLEQIAKDFAEVAQVLQLVDDAVTIAAAFKP